MDSEKQALLKSKLEDLKKKQSQQRQDNEKKQIIENIDAFYEKYRFADEFEFIKIEGFISQLHFSSPAHITISHISDPTPHDNMYLCFLLGSDELLRIYVFGKYKNLMFDIDTWKFLSPYLLLIDEDFQRYIYINDNDDMIEALL
ncbi:MAG: hypothetical protein K5876_05745 [Ruminiclostridium sp.]|nr:hypothetical protein [Ruminiclostridium sp.]